MDYDYDKYCRIISALVSNSDWCVEDLDDLEIGVNISPVESVKVIFDGFGDKETEDENGEYVYEEQGNKDMISFAVFLHRNTINDEEFPEHDVTPWALIHRPKEEICLYVWYDVENDEYEVLPLEDRISGDEGTMTVEEVMEIVDHLEKNYFNENY